MSCHGLVSTTSVAHTKEQLLVQLSCMQCNITLLVLHAGTSDLQASRIGTPSLHLVTHLSCLLSLLHL